MNCHDLGVLDPDFPGLPDDPSSLCAHPNLEASRSCQERVQDHALPVGVLDRPGGALHVYGGSAVDRTGSLVLTFLTRDSTERYH